MEGKQRRLYFFMDARAPVPVKLREAAVTAEVEKKKQEPFFLQLPIVTHQRHCLGILIRRREQQKNKFYQKSRSHLNLTDFSSFPSIISWKKLTIYK